MNDNLPERLRELLPDDVDIFPTVRETATEIERLTAANHKLRAEVAYLAAWKDEIEKGLTRLENQP